MPDLASFSIKMIGDNCQKILTVPGHFNMQHAIVVHINHVGYSEILRIHTLEGYTYGKNRDPT